MTNVFITAMSAIVYYPYFILPYLPWEYDFLFPSSSIKVSKSFSFSSFSVSILGTEGGLRPRPSPFRSSHKISVLVKLIIITAFMFFYNFDVSEVCNI